MATGFSVFVTIGGKVDKSLGGAIRSAEAQVGGLAGRLAAVHTRTSRTFAAIGQSVAKAGERLQTAGTAFTAGVSLPMGMLARSAGQTVYQMERAGNAVRAVTEMTAGQRVELERLARSQRYFGPVESMQAALELAKTGFSFPQIMGTLPGTLKLGLAGDIDAAKATDISTNVLTSLRLPMANAAQAAASMARVGDVFSYVANKTNTDVEKLGETFKYAANLGAATGQSLETLAGMAGVMANVGIRGPEAGVALRSAFVRMVRPTKPMLGALSRLGLNIGDFVTQSRTVDAEGILKTLMGRGLDASAAKGAIEKILRDPAAKFDVAKTVAGITDAIVNATGGGGAMDRDAIADGINEALLGAADKIDFVGFLDALKKKGATAGQIAAIFDQRQGSRLLSLLTGDLPSVIADVQKNSGGYIDRATELRLEGVVGSVKRLGAAYGNLQVSLGKSGVIDTVASAFERLANGLESIGKSARSLLRVGTYAALATVALGPLALAAGATLRVLGPLAAGLGVLGAAATTGLAARLVGVATGIGAITVAASLGAVSSLKGLAAGIIALGAVGGSKAVLGATAAGVAGLAAGFARLINPLNLARFAIAAVAAALSPVGIAVVGIAAALASLGVWTANNWSGIKTFFVSFGRVFKDSLGPTASGALDGLVTGLKAAWSSVNSLLGPLDATGEKWHAWGGAAGRAAAAVVNAVVELPGKVAGAAAGFASAMTGLAQAGYSAVINFDWAGLGSAIVSAIINGISSMASAFVAKLGEMASAGAARIKGMFSFGGTPTPAQPGGASSGVPLAGARALGGPVRNGLPYLVGERGPEIFVPSAHGCIETNGKLKSLAQRGVRTAQESSTASRVTRGGHAISHTWNINGANDPRAVAREVERLLARAEAEQRNSLMD